MHPYATISTKSPRHLDLEVESIIVTYKFKQGDSHSYPLDDVKVFDPGGLSGIISIDDKPHDEEFHKRAHRQGDVQFSSGSPIQYRDGVYFYDVEGKLWSIAYHEPPNYHLPIKIQLIEGVPQFYYDWVKIGAMEEVINS